MIRRAIIVLVFVLGLSGCDKVGLLGGLVSGGKPGVNANAQIGRTNNQTLGVSRASEQTLHRPQARTIEQSAGATALRAERVETVVVNEAPLWLFAIALLGWLLPSPSSLFRRYKDRRNRYYRPRLGKA